MTQPPGGGPTDLPPVGPGLRQRAEQALAERPSHPEPDAAQALHLLHELQVHQIELQMQNEALRKAQLDAQDALERLSRLHQTLEQQVTERTSELVVAREAAEAASLAKSMFVSNMSHELRTPLTGVLGMIGRALGRATDPQQVDWLHKASRSATHLLSVINNVLDLSKIEAEQLALAQGDVRLDDVLGMVGGLLGHAVTERGLAYHAEIAPALAGRVFRGDAQRLGQVLLNLAGNAVKFTDVGEVRITLREAGQSAGAVRVRFEVRDTGPGIAAEDMPRVFLPFVQLDPSSTRQQGGTGLGLAICRHMVQLMHGEVGVDSVRGQGSTFWFEVPLVPVGMAAQDADAQPSEADPGGQLQREFPGMTVLLAEDNPINQEVISALLVDAGLDVVVAADGEAAVDAARGRPLALILMDLHMPVLDGIQATRAIRQLPGLGRTPIIALTASAFEEDRHRCLEAGMDDHVPKPIDQRVLHGTVLRWLRRARDADAAPG